MGRSRWGNLVVAIFAATSPSAAGALTVGQVPEGQLPYMPRFETLRTNEHDFDWLHGRYEQEGAGNTAWISLAAWAHRKAEERTRQAQIAVARFQVRLNHRDTDGCYGDEPCQWIIRTERVAGSFATWEAFSSAWQEARVAAAAYLVAVDEAIRQMRETAPATTDLEELRIRSIQDQLLRAGLSDTTIALSPGGRRIYRLAIGLQVSRVDRANTQWLRGYLARSAWPLGTSAANSPSALAWLLVLHARDDPAFRFHVLGLLRREVDLGKMSPANFATRYDHILWETTGLQRYGTKGDCVGGRFTPAPAENERLVPALRRVIGLPTLEEQARILAPACANQ